jgi:hypothetical protein
MHDVASDVHAAHMRRKCGIARDRAGWQMAEAHDFERDGFPGQLTTRELIS